MSNRIIEFCSKYGEKMCRLFWDLSGVAQKDYDYDYNKYVNVTLFWYPIFLLILLILFAVCLHRGCLV